MVLRKSIFKWVGPIYSNQQYAWVKKESKLIIKNLDDLRSVKTIGIYRDDVGEQFLLSRGFTNLAQVTNPRLNLRKLLAGRIDVWVCGGGEYIKGILKDENVSSARIKQVLFIHETSLYLAFNINTSDAELLRWRNALNDLKCDGTIAKLSKKWKVAFPAYDPLTR
jgi:polar amino acid transport system substrate-binding protein